MNIRDTIDTQLNVLEKFDPIIPDDIKMLIMLCWEM